MFTQTHGAVTWSNSCRLEGDHFGFDAVFVGTYGLVCAHEPVLLGVVVVAVVVVAVVVAVAVAAAVAVAVVVAGVAAAVVAVVVIVFVGCAAHWLAASRVCVGVLASGRALPTVVPTPLVVTSLCHPVHGFCVWRSSLPYLCMFCRGCCAPFVRCSRNPSACL